VVTNLTFAEALIIVDAQRGFLEGPQAISQAGPLIDRLSQLLGRARQAGALVHGRHDPALSGVSRTAG
jgi:streptothricin hydrolase